MSAGQEISEGGGAERSARYLFLAAALVAFVAFVLVHVARGEAEGRGGAKRLSQLMAATRAEMIEVPLTPTQANWRLIDENGASYTLSELPPDTVVFLNFWATWCPPCREELPSMLALRQAMSGHRFVMLAVSYDESWEEIREFFTRWIGKLPPSSQLKVLKDEHLDPGTSLRETFGTNQLPDSYVIMNGKVLARFVNAREWTEPNIVEYFQTLAPPR